MLIKEGEIEVSGDYCTQIVEDLSTIGADAWNALLATDAQCSNSKSNSGNPFLRYEFLHALHETGCAQADSGWLPQYLTLRDGERLLAAVPLYAKGHSYGEYVFDWAWADAYARAGLRYYPKWLAAVPFTPVPGSRLLAVDASARAALIDALLTHARASGLSSLHVLYAPLEQIDALRAKGLLRRQGVQFHWHNSVKSGGYTDFDAFLAALTQEKRKKIRAERRKVDDAGVTLLRKRGAEISAADWEFFTRCYETTYAQHHSTPYLNLEFFQRIGTTMQQHLMLVLAYRGITPIAAALGVYDEHRLYGRYWGAIEHIPCLHFECCYYQMIEFAIEQRLRVFEGGAQGAHKLARGLDPVPTYSAHWIADAQMRTAIDRHLASETLGVEHTLSELEEHRAFKF